MEEHVLYKPLILDFEIPEEVQRNIDQLIAYLNSGRNPMFSDCERTELQCDLNWCKREGILEPEQIQLLHDYYVKGGIYKEKQL